MKAQHLLPSGPQGAWATPPGSSFCHHALFYDGDDDLTRLIEEFVREGLAGDERVLVVLSAPKLDSLRIALGKDAGAVQFADMDDVGANPARIIPLWRSVVGSVEPGQRIRGVGEPVHASRRGSELVECQIHEELLNLAFHDGAPFWLLCPYDVSSLHASVLDEARNSHPYLTSGDELTAMSQQYAGVGRLRLLQREDLSPAPQSAKEFSVTTVTVGSARQAVRNQAIAFGLPGWASDDLALAVHEVIANSLRYGGGGGELSMWFEDEFVICEVRDQGIFDVPMAGRIRPGEHGMGGRGLWMSNQLCDLVQIRSLPDATVVRLHMAATRPCEGASGAEPQT
jgi:anti-sigma regulatory factor (Ser/Thr protein kinase)